MNETCDLCGSRKMGPVYQPSMSVRGLSVFLCRRCGLLQSLPRIDHVPGRKVSISGGADWGNIRYGKGFRVESSLSAIQEVVDVSQVQHCLDVGSSRGDFAVRFHRVAPQARVLAIEPDDTLVLDYARDSSWLDLVCQRIEEVSLPKGRFDLVHCSHTLEHLRSPREVLLQIREAMNPDGILLLEVPNLALIGLPDVVEEWFLDKHLFHFSREILQEYLNVCGFQELRIWGGEAADENVTVIACVSHGTDPQRDVCVNPALVENSRRLVFEYESTVLMNRIELRNIARHIESIASRGVVIWGAGRLFDCLVRHGELNVKVLSGLVDKHLCRLAMKVHDCPLLDPEALAALKPGIIVVASRSFLDEITQEALSLVPGCLIIAMGELMKRHLP